MRTARQRVPTLSWRHWFARTGGCESVGNGGRESAGNGGRESVGNGGRGSVGTWLRGSVGTGLRWCICCAAAILIAIQLFIPPIVGLSDQGDFARVIGHFGYAREDKATPLADAYVAPKYVRDPHARFPELEQPTSEYIFVATALLLNKLVSRDGKFDIVIMGVVHGAAFLAAFARLLWVVRSQVLVWILAALALTDVGYVAYWNSFYSEPASCIFFLLLLAESIPICEAAHQSGAGLQPRERPPGRALFVVLRWSLWAVLLVIAKPQNFVLATLLVPVILRIGWSSMWGRRLRLPVRSRARLRLWGRRFRLPVRSKARSQGLRLTAASGAIAIAIASAASLSTFPRANVWATTYNQIFLAILPDSKDRAADLSDLGIDAGFANLCGHRRMVAAHSDPGTGKRWRDRPQGHSVHRGAILSAPSG